MSAASVAGATLRGLLRRRGAQFSAQRHRSTHSAEEPLDLVRLTTQIRDFSALCEPSDEEAVRATMKALDTNNDGVISKQELKRAVRAAPSAGAWWDNKDGGGRW